MARNSTFRGPWDVAGLFTDDIDPNEKECDQIRLAFQVGGRSASC